MTLMNMHQKCFQLVCSAIHCEGCLSLQARPLRQNSVTLTSATHKHVIICLKAKLLIKDNPTSAPKTATKHFRVSLASVAGKFLQ